VAVWPSIKGADTTIAQTHRLVSYFRSCALSAPFNGPTTAGRKLITEASRRRLGQRSRGHVTLEFTSGRVNRLFIAHAQNLPEVRH